MISVRERINPPAINYSQEVIEFSESINVPPILGKILCDRGVDSFEKAKDYFRPSLEQLHDPFLMPDMEKAADIERMAGENNLIFLGKIPFDSVFTAAMVQGMTIYEYDKKSKIIPVIDEMWKKIMALPVMNT